MRTSRAALLLAAASTLPAAALASTIQIDAAGGAAFTAIQPAVDAASPGDVLVVAPGNYGPFTCAKRLTIVGEPSAFGLNKPFVTGTAVFAAADGGALAGLRFQQLRLQGCLKPVIVDAVDAAAVACASAIEVNGCASVLLNHCELTGKPGDVNCETCGLTVQDSIVCFSRSTATGGKGGNDGCNGYSGRAGIEVQGDAQLVFVESTAIGGDGGHNTSFCGTNNTLGAPGIELGAAKSRAIVRGSGASYLQAGVGHQAFGGDVQYPWAASGSGRLTFSGGFAYPPAFNVGALTLPTRDESIAMLFGDDVAGSTKSFGVLGPPNSQFLLFVSFGLPAAVDAPPVLGSMLLAPAGPLVVLPLSLPTPTAATFDIVMPASLAGLEGAIATFQTVQTLGAPLGGTPALNPAAIVVR